MTDPNFHPETVEQFREAHEAVLARMADAARRAGRSPEEVRLIAVSKTNPIERVRLAVEAGMTLLGENRPQELAEKAEAIPGVTWCAIGHLQRNKAREVARYAHEFHALDSLRLAEALQFRLETEDRTLDVFIQVNASHEGQKSGFGAADVAPFLEDLAGLDRLRLRGLMTMAAFDAPEQVIRGSFAELRELRDRLQGSLPDGMTCQELSMGMTGDFEWAIEEGATSVRVGTAIFGHRANSAYLK